MFEQLKMRIHEINAARELKKYQMELNKDTTGLSATKLVDHVFSEKWKRFFWIKQIRSEILALCDLVEKRRPRLILEIGTANGGSLFLFTKLADPNAIIISIDLPRGEFGGGYPQYRTQFYMSFCDSNQKMHLIRDNSHLTSVFERVKEIIGNLKIDFLFIDGDHTYEGVKKDFDNYSSLVRETGIIALHDIAKHNSTSSCKVHEFWEDLKLRYDHVTEIIEDEKQNWAGIGVIFNQHKTNE